MLEERHCASSPGNPRLGAKFSRISRNQMSNRQPKMRECPSGVPEDDRVEDYVGQVQQGNVDITTKTPIRSRMLPPYPPTGGPYNTLLCFRHSFRGIEPHSHLVRVGASLVHLHGPQLDSYPTGNRWHFLHQTSGEALTFTSFLSIFVINSLSYSNASTSCNSLSLNSRYQSMSSSLSTPLPVACST